MRPIKVCTLLCPPISNGHNVCLVILFSYVATICVFMEDDQQLPQYYHKNTILPGALQGHFKVPNMPNLEGIPNMPDIEGKIKFFSSYHAILLLAYDT